MQNLVILVGTPKSTKEVVLRVPHDLNRKGSSVEDMEKYDAALYQTNLHTSRAVGRWNLLSRNMSSLSRTMSRTRRASEAFRSMGQQIDTNSDDDDDSDGEGGNTKPDGAVSCSALDLYKGSNLPDYELDLPENPGNGALQFRTKEKLSSSGASYSEVAFFIEAKRNYTFFIVNVMVVITLIITLSWTSMLIHPDQLDERLSVTLTLLLTAVAFKFVVVESLPKLSYLTYLDMFLFSALFYLVVVIAESAIVATIPDDETRVNVDRALCIGLAIFWVVHLLATAIFFVVESRPSNRKPYKKQLDFWRRESTHDLVPH